MLPNLYHVEHAESSHISEALSEARQNLFDEFRTTLDEDVLGVAHRRSRYTAFSQLERGFDVILNNATRFITNMKLRKIPFVLYESRIAIQIEHLDIELHVAQYLNPVNHDYAIVAAKRHWRAQVAHLENLKNLRLTLACGDARPSNLSKESVTGDIPLYFDDLLTGVAVNEGDLNHAPEEL